jgi:hypothetical protein
MMMSYRLFSTYQGLYVISQLLQVEWCIERQPDILLTEMQN